MSLCTAIVSLACYRASLSVGAGGSTRDRAAAIASRRASKSPEHGHCHPACPPAARCHERARSRRACLARIASMAGTIDGMRRQRPLLFGPALPTLGHRLGVQGKRDGE